MTTQIMKIITQKGILVNRVIKMRESIQSLDKRYAAYSDAQKALILSIELEDASAEDIAKALRINLDSVQLKCDECDAMCTEVIELVETPNYESATTWLCKDCVKKAYELFDLQ